MYSRSLTRWIEREREMLALLTLSVCYAKFPPQWTRARREKCVSARCARIVFTACICKHVRTYLYAYMAHTCKHVCILVPACWTAYCIVYGIVACGSYASYVNCYFNTLFKYCKKHTCTYVGRMRECVYALCAPRQETRVFVCVWCVQNASYEA